MEMGRKTLKVIEWMWIVSCSVPVQFRSRLTLYARISLSAEMLNEMENYRIRWSGVLAEGEWVRSPISVCFYHRPLLSFLISAKGKCKDSHGNALFIFVLFSAMLNSCSSSVEDFPPYISSKACTSVRKWIAIWSTSTTTKGEIWRK